MEKKKKWHFDSSLLRGQVAEHDLNDHVHGQI